MKTLYSFTFYLLMLFNCSSLFAQQNLNVTGVIVDENNKPADFVTVVLFKAIDSSVVKNTFTDEKGIFSFDVPSGSYYYKASMMGYNTLKSEKLTLSMGNDKIAFPTLKLTANTQNLAEVSVQAQKPLIERKMDRVVLNVASSSTATGSTALELLEKAPGVTVDQNDKISMLGKQGVLIQIDGKQTYMSNADVAALLKSMQSTEIETIELITNPSSKYDASGNSGIINIKTKKGKSGGTNGNVNIGAGYGKNYRANTGLSLNHRTKKFNFFGNYNYSSSKRERDMEIDRIVAGSPDTYFDQNSAMKNKYFNNNYKVGIDYNINKNNTIGVMVNGYFNKGDERIAGRTDIGRSFTQIDSSLVSTSHFDNSYKNVAFNLNYKLQLDSAGHELTADADYGRYNGNDFVNYTNQLFTPSGAALRPMLYTRNHTPSVIDIKTAKIDYVLPLKSKMKFEAGLKSSWVKTDNNLNATILNNNEWVTDVTRSNQFVYNENVNAAYLNLNKEFEGTSVQLGLRTEYTTSTGNSITTNKVIKRDYLDFFPSVFINQKLNKNNDLNFSYSRRIDRPNYDSLNPFLYFIDQYTYSQGNPFLNPQYTHNFEVTYLLKKKYSATFNYSRTNDVMMEVILPNDAQKALYQTYENLAVNENYALVLNAPVNFTKWWTSNNSLTGFYLTFKADDLGGKALDNKSTSFQFKTQHNYKINQNLSAELGFKYEAPVTYGVFDVEKRYSVDAGISKNLMNKKANLKLSVNDIFNTQNSNIRSALPGLQYWLRQQNDIRSIRLNFTYRFGNNEIKPARKRNTGLESESGRLKN